LNSQRPSSPARGAANRETSARNRKRMRLVYATTLGRGFQIILDNTNELVLNGIMRRLLVFAGLPFVFCLAAPAQDAPAGVDELMATANAKYLHRDYPASLALYEQARQVVEQGPAEDPRRWEVLKRLTTVASATGDYAAANRYLDAAIQWRLDRTGPADAQVLAGRLQQVGIYRAMGDDVEARAVLQTVIVKHEELGGRRNPALADDHSLMGQIDFESHKKEDAAQEWELAIALRGINAGPLDVTQVPDLDRLGGVYIELLRYQDAEDTYRKALIIRESVLGAEHADLLATLDGLAYAYFGEKKYDEAEAVYKRLVALWTKAVGETHPMLAIALDKLALFYDKQQWYAEAREAYERANAIRTLFLAQGLHKEALDIASGGDIPGAIALSRRAFRELDPPNPLYDQLREEISRNVAPEGSAAKKEKRSATKK
jgi:tetratricopeptide (TPR) repeat protein